MKPIRNVSDFLPMNLELLIRLIDQRSADADGMTGMTGMTGMMPVWPGINQQHAKRANYYG